MHRPFATEVVTKSSTTQHTFIKLLFAFFPNTETSLHLYGGGGGGQEVSLSCSVLVRIALSVTVIDTATRQAQGPPVSPLPDPSVGVVSDHLGMAGTFRMRRSSGHVCRQKGPWLPGRATSVARDLVTHAPFLAYLLK